MSRSPLGIQSIHSIDICVHDAACWLAYLTDGFGFQRVAVSEDARVEATGTREHFLRCGEVSITLSQAVHAGSRVQRYLRRHPEGIARVRFLVGDAREVEARLMERYAAPTEQLIDEPFDDGGRWIEVRVAVPIGQVEFCFVQIDRAADSAPSRSANAAAAMLPGMKPVAAFDAARNRLGLTAIDHMTINARTLMPVVAFCEQVLGFSRFWGVQFHTEDIRPGVGTGLRCVVMHDESSGVKLAINEPLRPRFDQSQVQLAIDAHRGEGVHHVAFGVSDIIKAFDTGRAGGVTFLHTPPAYYDALPSRIATQGISGATQSIADLRTRGILLDGDRGGYLLQAFCKNRPGRNDGEGAGPLFFELIQRCGAAGFGEGNFRALFEAMEQGG